MSADVGHYILYAGKDAVVPFLLEVFLLLACSTVVVMKKVWLYLKLSNRLLTIVDQSPLGQHITDNNQSTGSQRNTL